MKSLSSADLILNSDGSIYHLNLLPEDLAETIILVGDPDRVARVSKHFDRIEVRKAKREFVTHTGYIGDLRISVIGTGIGTDNIDIVINECDALANIDFKARVVKDQVKQLSFIRMGTSGGLHESLPVDSMLISQYAIGLDDVLAYYPRELTDHEMTLQQQCKKIFETDIAYASSGAPSLLSRFNALGKKGITLTCSGFYGPQNRPTRLPLKIDVFSQAKHVEFNDLVVTNAEMETAAIYGLSHVFGHRACSISAIVANRALGTFSKDVHAVVDHMIEETLKLLASPAH